MTVWARRSLLLLAVASLLLLLLAERSVEEAAFSFSLIHRFSAAPQPANAGEVVGRRKKMTMRRRRSMEHYQMLVNSDSRRQKMKLGPQFHSLSSSLGGKTMSLGNDLGWLQYTWIEVGTPRVPFLVALDAGSDLLWLPCDCVKCAPLSASFYSALEIKMSRRNYNGNNSIFVPVRSVGQQKSGLGCSLVFGAFVVQDRDLNEYGPSHSTTSKQLSCSHQLCGMGSDCKSPTQPCPYTIDYYTVNTSSSGLLVEDILHLATADAGHEANASVRASVIIGCGMKQSGSYLEGIAPDGLMGLGLSEISVPTLLAKAGLIRNSFSMCFDEDDSGRMYFGDQGPATQQSTAFLPLDGNYTTYIIGVESSCVGSSCLEQTSFRALVDTGTSFTYLPNEVYEKITGEFDRQVNANISSFEGYPWKYCYKSSGKGTSKVPSVKFMFPLNNSFIIHNPVFVIYGIEGIIGFCLAIQLADGDIGTIGQNFMTGYRIVFDRENLKLGWSRSTCEDLSAGTLNGTAQDGLPTNERQNTSRGDAVSPAVAGRAPSRQSAASERQISSRFCLLNLFLSLLLPRRHTLGF